MVFYFVFVRLSLFVYLNFIFMNAVIRRLFNPFRHGHSRIIYTLCFCLFECLVLLNLFFKSLRPSLRLVSLPRRHSLHPTHQVPTDRRSTQSIKSIKKMQKNNEIPIGILIDIGWMNWFAYVSILAHTNKQQHNTYKHKQQLSDLFCDLGKWWKEGGRKKKEEEAMNVHYAQYWQMRRLNEKMRVCYLFGCAQWQHIKLGSNPSSQYLPHSKGYWLMLMFIVFFGLFLLVCACCIFYFFFLFLYSLCWIILDESCRMKQVGSLS